MWPIKHHVVRAHRLFVIKQTGIAMQTEANATSTAGILDGLLTRQQIAEQFQVHPHTIWVWERAGLPRIVMSKVRLYEPAKVREWLLSHERRHTVTKSTRSTKKVA